MANKFKRIVSVFLTVVMCMSLFSVPAFAKTVLDNGNIWYGDQVTVDVTAGTEGYTFMSLFRKYVHGYEFGGHFMGDGEGPQTFVVIDTVEHDGTTWAPSGVYDPMDSNYEVSYCCDVETMIVDGTYYKRLNLEDSEYYNEAQAAKIRAIVTNSYPYVSLEAMKADLAANGYEYADALTRNEIIAAVQCAIWASANSMTADDLRYQRSYKVSDNLQWGYPLHDTSADSGLDVSGTRVFKTYEDVGTRIDSLVDHLLAQDAVYADKAQIVITELSMIGTPVAISNDTYSVALKLELNNSGSGYEDNINITVTAGDQEIVIPVELGKETYEINVTAKAGDEIKAVVSGTQVLPAGVYFYAPKAADTNSDGIATSREVSQNLVGVAMGETPVYAEATINFNNVSFNSGEVSNISYMFINKETGEVEFLKKIDIEEGATSAPIITADGYVSVMFMKQSTTGLFWFSENVDEETKQAAIDCLIDNNSSYKGHDEDIAFGYGAHELDCKNKTVTYIFGEGKVEMPETEDEDTVTDNETDVEEGEGATENTDGNDVNPEGNDSTEGNDTTEGNGNTEDNNTEDNNTEDNNTEDNNTDDVIEPENIDELGTKTSEKIDEDRYEIEIAVPGKDGETGHDEVILMVDGSYSMDNEWPAMKEAINAIGKTVLDGAGVTQLTLMAFGMGDNEVLVHVKDANELAAALGELPGNLLYGRSSTNCEAGFTGVAEYIANHDETLKDVHVIFISDGNVNTDETPRAFDANWQTWTKFGALAVAQETFGGTVNNGENLPAAFTTVFGNRFDGATREEILTRAFGGEVTDEEFLAFAEQVWTDVYAYSGLTRGTEYPVSDAERAFVKYDKENGTYIQDLFYYTTYKSAYVTYGDRWTRTPAAANALAAMDEVEAMYVVDYDSYTAWMDTGITSDKSTFVQSNGIAGLCEALSGALTELSKTPFNNVVVTDYMSKWVNIDLDTLKIVDNSTGETIWTATEGWAEGATHATEQEKPVVVELVDPSEYAAGGEDVIGNTSGDIYKLTWYVKDGAMLRSDNYSLKYEVTVDTAENGFQYNNDYPANGNTDLKYIDENGEAKGNAIIVPNVEAEAPEDMTISFKNGEASNISFMLIDPTTGEVEFLKKYDIGGETTYVIPAEAGKISAVFVKQSTSGMFWFSEEVNEDIVNATIECLKANNPSYKGHNAIAFGEGEHVLEFKTNKFVTYTFVGGTTILDSEANTLVVEDELVVDETVDEGTANDENVTTIKKVKINGEYAENTIEIDGLIAVYVPAEGKIPAFIWVEDPTIGADAVIAFGADTSITVAYGDEVSIKYQQNKNKTKTASFTFEIVEE